MLLTVPHKKRKRIGMKDEFLGCFVHQDIADYLRLYALANNKTISEVARTVFVEWKCHNALNSILVSQIQHNLSKLLKKVNTNDIDKFLEDAEKELRRKKINEEIIFIILKKFKNAKNEENRAKTL